MSITDQVVELRRLVEEANPGAPLTDLRPGADRSAIAISEQRVGIDFPDELRELYLFTNGGFITSRLWTEAKAIGTIDASVYAEHYTTEQYTLHCDASKTLDLTPGGTWTGRLLYSLAPESCGQILFHYVEHETVFEPMFDNLEAHFDYLLEAARRDLFMINEVGDLRTIHLRMNTEDPNRHFPIPEAMEFIAEYGFSVTQSGLVY